MFVSLRSAWATWRDLVLQWERILLLTPPTFILFPCPSQQINHHGSDDSISSKDGFQGSRYPMERTAAFASGRPGQNPRGRAATRIPPSTDFSFLTMAFQTPSRRQIFLEEA